MNDNQIITMVNKRGRVMYVKRWEIDNLKTQGCKIIFNPKEEYYAIYDEELNKRTISNNIIENIDNSDILQTIEI